MTSLGDIINIMEVKLMRLSCEYTTEKIPVANKMLFVSLIKEAIKRVNKEYYEKLYNFEGKNNKQIKPFCFGVFLKGFKLEGDIINIEDRVVFNVSTPDYEFGINLYNGLLNINQFKYKGFVLNKLRISLVKEKSINEEQVVFKTMAPICIKDKNNQFILPNSKIYERELNYIADKNISTFRGYGLKKPLQFQEVLMKKAVVKEEITAFKDKAQKEIFYVNAASGIFKLTGDIEDLNFIYQAGIGFRRSQGFGMVDIV